jgi:SH3-like domain-containing protein
MTTPAVAMSAPFRSTCLFAVLIAALVGALVAFAPGQAALAQGGGAVKLGLGPSGLPLPRFVTLRAAEVNLRSGPGVGYPIEWVFTRRGLPVEIIDEFETWRHIRDWQGSEGWVHQTMLSGQRGAMVVGAVRLLRRAPEPGAAAIAEIEIQVVGRLHQCRDAWCLIEASNIEGWLRQNEIYGAYPGETFN